MTNTMKLKVRRAEAQRSARVDAAAEQTVEAARLASVAADLDASRGYLRKCGVARAVVLDGRVFVEVRRNRPSGAVFSGVSAGAVAMAAVASNMLTPWYPEGTTAEAADLYTKLYASIVLFGFLLVLSILSMFWRSSVHRFHVRLSEWASPTGRLLLFVKEAKTATELAGGFGDSNRRLCKAAAGVPTARRSAGHSSWDRLRMEWRGLRGA